MRKTINHKYKVKKYLYITIYFVCHSTILPIDPLSNKKKKTLFL